MTFDDVLDRIHPLWFVLLCLCISAPVAWRITSVQQKREERWEQFKQDHHCEIISRDETSSFLGPGPSETFRCDDGREYKRPLKP